MDRTGCEQAAREESEYVGDADMVLDWGGEGERRASGQVAEYGKGFRSGWITARELRLTGQLEERGIPAISSGE